MKKLKIIGIIFITIIICYILYVGIEFIRFNTRNISRYWKNKN